MPSPKVQLIEFVAKHRLLFFLVSVLLAGCLGTDCVDELQSTAVSPDGKYIASLFTRDCGATTDWSTLVSVALVSSRTPLKEQSIAAAASGKNSLRMQWTSSTTLHVEADAGEKLFPKPEFKLGDVVVEINSVRRPSSPLPRNL